MGLVESVQFLASLALVVFIRVQHEGRPRHLDDEVERVLASFKLDMDVFGIDFEDDMGEVIESRFSLRRGFWLLLFGHPCPKLPDYLVFVVLLRALILMDFVDEIRESQALFKIELELVNINNDLYIRPCCDTINFQKDFK